MTVLEAMNACKAKGIQECWIGREGILYLHGFYGYSSIENPEYIKQSAEMLQAEVLQYREFGERVQIEY